MELEFESSGSSKPPISKAVIHDDEGQVLFALVVDNDEIKLENSSKDITDQLIKSKQILTTDRGVESIGALIAGAERDYPSYHHLLTFYVVHKDGAFDKYHITLFAQLGPLTFAHTMLLTAECQAILLPVIEEYMKDEKVELDDYPLLRGFFNRFYEYPAYQNLLDGDHDQVKQLRDQLIKLAEDKRIEAMEMGITTISGALIALTNIKGTLDKQLIINQATNGSITTPGTQIEDGVLTLWFPFTKSKVGKINRTMGTTMVTLNYASGKQQSTKQTQRNLAHKFAELLDVVSNGKGSLKTNVGHLICTVKIAENYNNNLDDILATAQLISNPVKNYGVQVLKTVAETVGFEEIS